MRGHSFTVGELRRMAERHYDVSIDVVGSERRKFHARTSAMLYHTAELLEDLLPKPTDAEHLVWMMKPKSAQPFELVDDAGRQNV